MKKKLFTLFFCVNLICYTFAQVSVEPGDYFYTLAQGWEIRGLTDCVPPMRPYPLANIKQILSDVMENGTPKDVELARYYWEKITGKKINIELNGKATAKLNAETEDGETSFKNTETDSSFYMFAEPNVYGDLSFANDLVSLGYYAGIAVYKGDEEDFIPMYTNSMQDTRTDEVEAGPLELYTDVNTAVAVGKTNIFAQTGVYRTGFGPFLGDGISNNDSAFHSTNFSFTVLGSNVSYTQTVSGIGASKSYDGDGILPDKFIASHAIEYKPTKKLSASYYENVVYGRRFDPSYLVPAPFMIVQQLTGFVDNVQMGFLVKWIPVDDLMWVTDIMADDIDLEKAIKLNLNSKNRIAMQNGFIYTPKDSYCSRLEASYTFITPYTYSHWDYDDEKMSTMSKTTYNYQNYTNNGQSMGASIPPNSDRFRLAVDFLPKPNLHIKVSSSFLRHANIAESLSDEEAVEYLSAEKGVYSTDGSIFTHSMFQSDGENGRHVESAWEELNFLNQDHQMYVAQAGFDLSYDFPKLKWGQISLNLGYNFEYIHNKGVDAPLYSGLRVLDDDDNVSYRYEGREYAESEIPDLLDSIKDAWKDNLHDEMNHYITVGGTIKF